MKKTNNYKYLLEDLTKLKGVGKKTAEILKKKKLITYLIYFGDFLNPTLTELKKTKLMNYK